jgi:hypothetical protein
MALTTEHRIYVALGLLAALGGGVYLTQKDQKAEETKHVVGAASVNLPEMRLPADDVDKITKIEIKNADKGSVTLEKVGADWRMKKPVDYPANAANVKTLLDNLKEVKGKEQIDSGSTAFAEYGVDDAKAVKVTLYKGADKGIELFFGKSGGRGQMARKTGQDGVFAVSGYSAYLYTREVKNWRDTTITKFEEDKPTKVEIENENGRFVFTKDGDAWTAKAKGTGKDDKLEKIERFDEAKVKDMLRAFKALAADDFADDKGDADTGLDKPAAKIVITLKDGEPVKLNVGKTSSGDSRFLRKEGTPQVFTISSWSAGWAVAKTDKFQKADEKKPDDKKDDKKKDDKKDDKKK